MLKMASDSEGLRLDNITSHPTDKDTQLKMASDSEGLRHKQITCNNYQIRFLLKMASDSEGLRQNLQSEEDSLILLKMASDSEGLRLLFNFIFNLYFVIVENGFRFGRVTTYNFHIYLLFYFFLLKMASDSEGLRPID